MNTRRSFFGRFGAAIATIALAPELAFRAKLALPEVESWTLFYAANQSGVYQQLVECSRAADQLETAKESKLNLEELFQAAYELKRQRQKAGISEHYILVKIET